MTDIDAAGLSGTDTSLIIVDDDKAFLQRLGRAMEARGYTVTTADTVAEGLAQVEGSPPAFAVIDMKLTDGSGLDVISRLKVKRPDARGIILTGYGNIATAVTAVKLGAFDYIAKPADADDIHAALLGIAEAIGKPQAMRSTALDIRRDGFGEHPHFHVLIAEIGSDFAGMCLYFPIYSTWMGRPGAYVQDLFVHERFRGGRIGERPPILA